MMQRHKNRWCGIMLAAVCSGGFPVFPAAGEPATCATCHHKQHQQLGRSVHAALRCQDCHGGAESYGLTAQQTRAYQTPATRGESRPVFDHGTTFTGKPARREVPERCGTCHADVERMNPFGLRTDQLARYRVSAHGKALQQGEDRVAVCVDCHGSHGVLSARDPQSRTHPFNVPNTCATCHANAGLMAEFDLPVEIVEEYRQSVHGRLLLEQGDRGAPTCATCHGNHAAAPPGFATVSAVCGRCHEQVAKNFATSIHADQEAFQGCVQCHGGGADRHFHLIERITKPSGAMIQRYAHLLASQPHPSAQQIADTIDPDPKRIITQTLSTCTECHDEIDEDESLPKLFTILDSIATSERHYVETANRLDRLAQGVLLVSNQRFKFQDAKTQLIGLAAVQHTLNNTLVANKVAKLNTVCDEINAELDDLERGLRFRHAALIPIWAFALLFALILYIKFKRLKAMYVKPPSHDPIA